MVRCSPVRLSKNRFDMSRSPAHSLSAGRRRGNKKIGFVALFYNGPTASQSERRWFSSTVARPLTNVSKMKRIKNETKMLGGGERGSHYANTTPKPGATGGSGRAGWAQASVQE